MTLLDERIMDDWKTIGLGAAAAGLASAGLFYVGYRLGKRCNLSKSSRKGYLVSDGALRYLKNHNVHNPVLMKLRTACAAHTHANMTTALETDSLLTQLTRALGARKCIDVGVFMGCSSFAMALGLPKEGRVVACDISTEYTSQGKPFWEEGGVADKIDLRIQPADQTLEELISSGESGTYDLIFIDANKSGYTRYYELGVQLLRPGGMIVVDNSLWGGKVYDPKVKDADTNAVRQLNDRMTNDDRVFSVLLIFDVVQLKNCKFTLNFVP